MEVCQVRLFISNSDNVLKKIILLSISGFLIYSLVLEIAQPKITKFQNSQIENYSKAEQYIYNLETPKVVIVGSSLANRLQDDILDEMVYNLSFSGGSVLTGLNVIKKTKNFPEIILIETNIVEKEEDSSMVDNLFPPLIGKIRGKILSFQNTYQLINIFLSFLQNHLFDNDQRNHMKKKPDDDIFENNLKHHIQNNNAIHIHSESKELSQLHELVEFFRNKGIKIIFFQMPVNRSIITSKNYQQRKTLLINKFPNSQFNWIIESDYDRYHTTDGIHLLYESAIDYSYMLNQIIENNLGNSSI